MNKTEKMKYSDVRLGISLVPKRWTLEIPGWMPTRLNQMTGRHWAKGHRLKKHDKEIVAIAVAMGGVPAARCRRRVSLLIVLPKGQRAPDPDAFDKSLRDALVACGALKNDSAKWVQGDDPRFARGRELVSFVTLEDV
jgi:hypothetical protein